MTTIPFDTNKLIEICRQNDVAMIGVFGSMARGEVPEQVRPYIKEAVERYRFMRDESEASESA